MDTRRGLGMTAGKCVAHGFHRRRFDAGALAAEVFETRIECGVLLWPDGGDVAHRARRRQSQRVSCDAHLRALEGRQRGVWVALSQAKRAEGARGMSAHLPRVDVPRVFTGELAPFFAAFAKIRRHCHKIELVSGAPLVAIGVLIFANSYTLRAGWPTPYLPEY